MRSAAFILLLCAGCAAQVAAPAADTQGSANRESFSNHRVIVSLAELAPHESTPKQPHAHDLLAVFLNDGRIQNKLLARKLMTDKVSAGEVRFRDAAAPLDITNEGDTPLRFVVVEFNDPQGKVERLGTTSRTCSPESPAACFDEHNLFCTAKVCVEDVVLAPGAVTHRHSHATDHMLVAVSDYELSDQVEGKGTVARTRKGGEIEYLAAPLTHQLSNASQAPAHFVVILWR